jgi:mRNA-degrading endonuclease RelE of RelBE toxin-antitoxin system
MKRLVIQTRKFSETLDLLIKQNKVAKEDFEELEKSLVENPTNGDPIQGTGGLRKARLKSTARGKSGGFRICYCDVKKKEKLFLIVIYAKNVKENLTKEEIKILGSLVEKLEKE